MKLSRIRRCTGKDFHYEHLNFLDQIDKEESIYFLDHQSLLNSVSCPIKKREKDTQGVSSHSYSVELMTFALPNAMGQPVKSITLTVNPDRVLGPSEWFHEACVIVAVDRLGRKEEVEDRVDPERRSRMLAGRERSSSAPSGGQ